MFSLLIIAVLVQTSMGLIGYDCGSRSLNITTLSLLDVGPCNIPQSKINVTRRYIQLLQINEFTQTTVIQCKIEYHRTVYYCGMNSHVSIVKHGEGEYISEVSRKQCQEVYGTGILRIGDTHVISGIRLNQTVTYPILLAGYLDRDGNCKGAAYSDPYGSWESVVVQGTIRITISRQEARVDLSNNKIHLRSGTTCTLSDGECVDVLGGYSFWNSIPMSRCRFDKYSILYEGLANKIVDLDYNHETTVYSLSQEDVTFALTSKSKEFVCGYTIFRTEHPKLVIFETTKGESFADRSKVSVNNLDIFAYVNSKFVYVERHIRTQIKHLYQDVLVQRCNLERETLKNALSIATQAPDQFAYHLMKGPGYMAVTAGEVVHVIKCIPVEVKIEHGDDCYAELQVTRRNTTYFMTPRTHILKSKGTKVTCNPLLPSHYFLDESWYKILPRPTEALKPVIIQPMTNPTWKYINPASLATSGIYTERDLDELRDHIMFPVEKSALLNDIAREIRGHPVRDNEGTIIKLLNNDAMEKIVKSTWGKLWNKFIAFGTASAGILAIFVIIQGIKMLVEVLINGYLLHQMYGWSIHLLGAIWSSIAHLLININKTRPVNCNKSQQVDVEQPILQEHQPQENPSVNIELQTVTPVVKKSKPNLFSLPK